MIHESSTIVNWMNFTHWHFKSTSPTSYISNHHQILFSKTYFISAQPRGNEFRCNKFSPNPNLGLVKPSIFLHCSCRISTGIIHLRMCSYIFSIAYLFIHFQPSLSKCHMYILQAPSKYYRFHFVRFMKHTFSDLLKIPKPFTYIGCCTYRSSPPPSIFTAVTSLANSTSVSTSPAPLSRGPSGWQQERWWQKYKIYYHAVLYLYL